MADLLQEAMLSYNEACDLVEENESAESVEELLMTCLDRVKRLVDSHSSCSCSSSHSLPGELSELPPSTSKGKKRKKSKSSSHSDSHDHDHDHDHDHAHDHSLDPQVSVLYSRAEVLLGQIIEWKDYEHAQNLFQHATEIDSNNSEAFLQLARIKWKHACTREELEEVENLLKKAIELSETPEEDDPTFYEAKKLLSRYLCQLPLEENRLSEAHELLLSQGYKYSLSKEILTSLTPPSPHSTPSSTLRVSRRVQSQYICSIDQILSQTLLSHLQESFSFQSSFWTSHQYDSPSTGFFSYQHPLEDYSENLLSDLFSSEQQNHSHHSFHSLERCIYQIWWNICQVLPYVKRAKYAEWWVHTRPHCNGHKLHYDYILHENQMKHPLISSVTFLSASCGGPTLVTNETVSHPYSSHGWLLYPTVNRTICFNGQQLHCVLPGYGPSPAVDSRRTTFMIAFWEDDCGASYFPLITPIESCDRVMNVIKKQQEDGRELKDKKKKIQKKSSSKREKETSNVIESSSTSDRTTERHENWIEILTKPLPKEDTEEEGERGTTGSGICDVNNPLAIRYIDRVVERCQPPEETIERYRESEIEENRQTKRSNKAKKTEEKTQEQKTKKKKKDTPVIISLLEDSVFSHFEALNSGLVLAAKSTCSLNCGGTCEQCVALATVKSKHK